MPTGNDIVIGFLVLIVLVGLLSLWGAPKLLEESKNSPRYDGSDKNRTFRNGGDY